MVDNDSSSRNTWFDTVVTPLNACSLETYTPIRNEPPTEEISDCKIITENENDVVIPLIIGCYQLNEQLTDTTTNGEDKNKDDNDNDISKSSSRSGELRLYMISSSPSTTLSSSTSIKFGSAHDAVQMESGVLDGKWRRRQCKPVIYASACASGRMHLHSLEKNNSQQTWTLSHLTSSDETDGNALCLSLAWNDFVNNTSNDDTNIKSDDQIVSSYSNGTVALHKVATSTITNESQDVVSIEETHRWNAHTMFGCPSEVWTCSFLRGDENVVLSGADDMTLKVWDTRQTQRHIHKIGESEFDAGVTAISSHPSIDHVFAVGSYDEYVRIYDYRKMDQPISKVHVGGGVWRIKWHPSCYHKVVEGDISNSGKMLVAAMHGGCRVVNVPILGGDDGGDVEILSQFTAHESMAYGADWISSNKCEVVSSCSFYDRQAFIWNPNSS